MGWLTGWSVKRQASAPVMVVYSAPDFAVYRKQSVNLLRNTPRKAELRLGIKEFILILFYI
ncbi:MAG: hypothetical protein ACRD4L_12860 [Pyrinomonadaceae bacterium]